MPSVPAQLNVTDLSVAVTDAQALASSLLTLQGAGAYDAAVHCASVSAARRLLQQQQAGGPDGQQPPPNDAGYR